MCGTCNRLNRRVDIDRREQKSNVAQSMSIHKEVENKLNRAFQPVHLEVINESNNHNVPPGSESHFKVVVVCEAFEGARDVQRHQRIYKVLADELAGQVHALAIHAYTPEEWKERQAEAPQSPDCMGGSVAEQKSS